MDAGRLGVIRLANISTFLQKILDAVYGEEVRGSIHDALAAMNEESSDAMEFAETARDSARAFADSAKTSAAEAGSHREQIAVDAAATEAARNAAAASKTDAQASAAVALDAKNAVETAANLAENAKTVAEEARDAAAASARSAEQYSGKPPKPQNGTWWIWDAEAQQYIDSGISCELAGADGVGVAGIELTRGDHSPGTTDIYTVTLTDGTTYNISVYNGMNGTGAGDMLGITFDLLIPAAGWQDGSITVADSRFIALATHKYFIDAYADGRDAYIECNVQPKDIIINGFITFTSETQPTADLTVNVIRMELSANGTS